MGNWGNRNSGHAIIFTPITIGITIAVGTLVCIDRPFMTLVLIAVICGLLLFSLMVRHWEAGIYILFVWLVFDDSVRKYTGNYLGEIVTLYFVKDAILVLTYLAYFSRKLFRNESLCNWKSTVMPAIGVLALWGLLCSVHAGQSNLLLSLVGLRMWFIYCPLLFLGIDFAQSNARVRCLLRLWVISAGIVSLLGLLQVMFGNDLLNPAVVVYNAPKLFVEKTGVSGLVLTRPTSVFINSGRYGKYTIMSFCLVWGALLYFWQESQQRRKDTILTGTCLGLICIMGFLSGARTLIVAFPFIFILFLFVICRVMRTKKKKGTPHGSVVKLLVMLTIIGGALWQLVAGVNPGHLDATFDFSKTTSGYAGVHYGLHRRDILFSVQNFWLLGNGVGSTSMGINYFISERPFKGVETGYASLIIEFGMVGLILWVWIGLGLIRASLRALAALKDSCFIGLAFAALLLQWLFMFVLFTLGVAVYQDYLVSCHLWFLTGLIIGICRANKSSTAFAVGVFSQTSDAEIQKKLGRQE